MKTEKRVPVITHHPKDPNASQERLRQLAGIAKMRGPLPSPKFLETGPDDDTDERARD
jgi:hypothetical protein